MNTTENNKLIAEFMGWEIIENQSDYWVDCNPKNEYAPLQLINEIFKDWNWLMEVVEKIESIENYRFDIESRQSVVSIYDKDKQEDILEVVFDIKINAVYNAWVEFIKWYNDKEKYETIVRTTI